MNQKPTARKKPASWTAGTLTVLSILLLFTGAVEKAASPPSKTLPLSLTIEPEQDGIFSRQGHLPVRFVLRALQPVTLCLDSSPLIRLQLTLNRLGVGPVAFAPIVVMRAVPFTHDPPVLQTLAPGRSYPLRVDLRQIPLQDGAHWASGEYLLNATYRLCDAAAVQSGNAAAGETSIPAERAVRFYLAE